MSKLQSMVTALVDIIIDYSKTQQSQHTATTPHPSSVDRSDLTQIIQEATKQYSTRLPMLEYFHFLFVKLNPLVNQEEPLSPPQSAIVFHSFLDLINNIKRLANSSHSEKPLIYYDDKKVPMYGFLRGFMKGYSLSNLGQIIQNNLFQPFKLNFKSSEEEINATIAELIHEHQAALYESAEKKRLLSENKQLKELLQKELLKKELKPNSMLLNAMFSGPALFFAPPVRESIPSTPSPNPALPPNGINKETSTPL